MVGLFDELTLFNRQFTRHMHRTPMFIVRSGLASKRTMLPLTPGSATRRGCATSSLDMTAILRMKRDRLKYRVRIGKKTHLSCDNWRFLKVTEQAVGMLGQHDIESNRHSR